MSPPSSNHPTAEQTTSRVTDSPLFWLPIFLVGALVALLLTGPKYSWRQPQIERQFQARERSGQAVSAAGGYSPLSTENNAMLTLRPLVWLFTVLLLVATALFWLRRIVRRWQPRVPSQSLVEPKERPS